MAVTIGSVTEGNANAEEIKNNSPDSELYEKNKKYLQGSLVKFNDKIYLAKRNVPSDVDLDNPYYWEIFMDAADSKRVDELFEKTGNLDELETESKDNLVAAINEAVLYTAQSLTEEQQAQARANIGADISTKMDANNPVGTGSFSMNRKAGTVIGTNSHTEGFNTTASQSYSHAEGSSTQASGYSSHSEGYSTTASGTDSHAEGDSTTASGGYSHAEGGGTTASQSYSHAEGNRTTASGQSSHAEGNSTNKFSSVVTKTNPTKNDIITAWKTKKFSVAKGDYSHVEGKDNLSLGDYSHAEGYQTTASGENSHAEGYQTIASKNYSHAEGSYTTASGHSSHAEGSSTTAIGYHSHAEGNYSTASGFSSHAEGSYTKASGDHSHVQGKCNIEDTSSIYADIIGNGTSNTARSNAATVDWNGNAWFAGDVYVGSTSGTNKDEGSKKLATEEYVNNSIAAGGTDISLGLTSAAVGQTIKVKAIDESGKPTAWEAADMPSGGGAGLWEHICDITATEEIDGGITISENREGVPLSELQYNEIWVLAKMVGVSTNTNNWWGCTCGIHQKGGNVTYSSSTNGASSGGTTAKRYVSWYTFIRGGKAYWTDGANIDPYDMAGGNQAWLDNFLDQYTFDYFTDVKISSDSTHVIGVDTEIRILGRRA